jgi:CPA1 family monovalent cation:H+ antiporter
MTLLHVTAVIVTVSALFAYINHRFIRLPTTIGVMLIALAISLVLIGLGALGLVEVQAQAERLLAAIDFDETVLRGFLSFLLFAGALHVNINDLASQKWVIASLASGSMLLSALIVGCLAWLLFGLLGLDLPLVYCLLFGALISPTDPIAVLGILKGANAPKSLEAKIAGESLFNDGVAVVVFLVLLGVATGDHALSAGEVVLLFIEEALGGTVFGLAIGYVAYRLLKTVDSYQVEILLTLALVTGGYSLASELHVSGPIAMVVAGLLIGNHGRAFAMSEETREHLDTFWELIDELLNVVLFVLIGLEVLVLSFTGEYLLAALAMIPIVLLARLVSVGLPIGFMRLRRAFTPGVVKILTWGGLRGGISVALAMSLPKGSERDAIVAVTYIIVVFSIAVQGLTVGRMIATNGRARD